MTKTVEFVNRMFEVKCPYNKEFIENVKTIPGTKWNPTIKAWILPINEDSIRFLSNFGFDLPERALSYYNDQISIVNKISNDIQHIREIGYNHKIFDIYPVDYSFGNWKPYPHQYAGFVIGINSPFLSLLFEPGLGKTFTFLHVIKYRLINNLNKRFLVVTPDKVKFVWRDEIAKFLPELIPNTLIISSGLARQKRIELLEKANNYQIIILNYEMLAPYYHHILNIDYDGIVLDESTKIKNPRAKMTKAALSLATKAIFKAIGTGTPITESILELFTQFYFLNKYIIGIERYNDFENLCAIKRRIARNGREFDIIVGIKDKEANIVKKKVARVSLSCTDEDVGDVIKDNISLIRRFELNPLETDIYSQVANGFIEDWESGKIFTFRQITTVLNKLRQVVNGFIYLEDGVKALDQSSKIQVLQEILEEYYHRKILIWTLYKYDQTLIERLFKQMKINPATYGFISGATNSTNADQLVNEFKRDKLQILVAQINTLKFGLTIPCDASIFYGNPWSWSAKYQAMRRSERIGVNRRVRYIDLIAQNTIEETIYQILQNKQEMVSELRRLMKAKKLDMQSLIYGNGSKY